jgi:ABC-type nickel/cobalt efflux system permease component RcnA
MRFFLTETVGTLAILGVGLVFGLKHATELDHVVAVSSIVSQHRSVFRSALVGGLWGLGHSFSLLVVGVLVLVLRFAIPPSLATWLEFGVGLMIIALGVSALMRVWRRKAKLHSHEHAHDGLAHVHIHFHEHATEHRDKVSSHSHSVTRVGLRPFLVGAMHGLAGSAALTLLLLTQISSAWLGLMYLALFGLGSAFGMLVMSSLIGLPFMLSGRKLSGLNYGLQAAAGCLSIAFGLWYAYAAGVISVLR